MTVLGNTINISSAHQCKRQIQGAILIGFLLITVTAIGSYHFISQIHVISIEGTASWKEGTALETKFETSTINKLHGTRQLAAEFIQPNGNSFRSPVKFINISSQNQTLSLEAPGVPDNLKNESHFTLRLILEEKPYWKFLWETL